MPGHSIVYRRLVLKRLSRSRGYRLHFGTFPHRLFPYWVTLCRFGQNSSGRSAALTRVHRSDTIHLSNAPIRSRHPLTIARLRGTRPPVGRDAVTHRSHATLFLVSSVARPNRSGTMHPFGWFKLWDCDLGGLASPFPAAHISSRLTNEKAVYLCEKYTLAVWGGFTTPHTKRAVCCGRLLRRVNDDLLKTVSEPLRLNAIESRFFE